MIWAPSGWTSLTYYPSAFKASKDSLKDQQLKFELFKILTQAHQTSPHKDDTLTSNCQVKDRGRTCFRHTKLDYSVARKYLFGVIHLKEGSNGSYVEDVYCRKEFYKKHGIGTGKIPNNKYINCEHTWPQSKFNRKMNKDMQRGDLHHLFPTDSRANNFRANYPFGNVESPAAKKDSMNCKASDIGYQNSSHGNLFFEPPTEHKGNVARALFYFAVRYKMQISHKQEKFLRDWHREDPVDANERDRNQKVFDIQKNRNPFIDYPELVDQISNF